MTTPIQPIITNAGLAAALAQEGNGLRLGITHVQLGTGGYTLNTAPGSPDFDRTALVAPSEASAIAGGHVNDIDASFRVDLLLAPWVGSPYPISEIGFWAGDPANGGVLFSYWAQATVIAYRNMLSYLATYQLKLVRVPFASVEVVVDPNIAWLISLLGDHESALNPHPQYRFPRHRGLYLSGI